MTLSLRRRLAAEGIGSALLFSAVVGSGIMAERLASGNIAVALLANSIATGAILFVLITMLGPVSGAHFNPAVSAVAASRDDLRWRDAAAYMIIQIVCGILGVWITHVMFGVSILQFSTHSRTGIGQWTGEAVATFGLVLTIIGTVRHRREWVPASVALYITAAYWFTSSTSFANPAITIARSLSDSFAGIAPEDVPGFIVAQVMGAAAAALISTFMFDEATPQTKI
jgi:glycerol uptake facilitator-like aquaporin